MAIDLDSIKKLRRRLSRAEDVKKEGFSILQEIAYLLNFESVEYKKYAHEMVLRCLHMRSHFDGYIPILNGFCRQLGLYPYISEECSSLADQLAYEFHKPDGLGTTVFHRVQAEIYRDLMDGKSIVLSAPTSFGKSLITDAIIASGKFSNIAIIVPTIALIDETRRRLTRFRRKYKVITHASQEVADKTIFVMTQERAVECKALDHVEFFVIDEFYKLQPSIGDTDRSMMLNQALYKLLKNAKQFYLLGPTIKNIPEGFKDRFQCRFIATDYTTVVSEVRKMPESDEPLVQLVDLCRVLKEQTLIYCASPQRVNDIAQLLMDKLGLKASHDLRDASEWVGSNFHPDWKFAKALSVGIGIHHGRIPRSLSQFNVKAFNEGHIKYLICTSTLIEGVNTAAKNVVVFDNRRAKRKLDYFTYNNIKGRSGRMLKHFIGRVYIFHTPPEQEDLFIDIPMYSQSDKASDALLIQMDQSDLTKESAARLNPILKQPHLNIGVIRENRNIDPTDQIELAKYIRANAVKFSRLMSWHQYPNWDELLFSCGLIWRFFVKLKAKQKMYGIWSARHLTFRLNRLSKTQNIRRLIADILSGPYPTTPDEAVEDLLDFLRHWASFYFPKYIMAIDRIQRSVFQSLQMSSGDYSLYAAQCENLFMDSTVMNLEEYGFPMQLTKRLIRLIRPDGNLDTALSKLRTLSYDESIFNNFENGLIEDAIAHL